MEEGNSETLILLIEIVRHGARHSLFPDFPVSLEQTNKVGLVTPFTADITPLGVQEQYDIGCQIRENYFRGEKLREEEILVYTSNFTRAIHSAKLQILGVADLLSKEGEVINILDEEKRKGALTKIGSPIKIDGGTAEDIVIWTPIITDNLWHIESLFINKDKTPQKPEMETPESYFQTKLYPELSQLFNKPISQFEIKTCYKIWDVVHAAEYHKQQIIVQFSEGARKYLTEATLHNLHEQLFKVDEGWQFLIAGVVEKVIMHLEGFGLSVMPKLIIFSAHDLNITAFLLTLGVKGMYVPDFSSRIFIEVYQRQNGEKIVRVKFIDGNVTTSIDVHGLGHVLLLDQFIAVLKAHKLPETLNEFIKHDLEYFRLKYNHLL